MTLEVNIEQKGLQMRKYIKYSWLYEVNVLFLLICQQNHLNLAKGPPTNIAKGPPTLCALQRLQRLGHMHAMRLNIVVT